MTCVLSLLLRPLLLLCCRVGAGMTSLNRVQSRVADSALYSSENMLVCAPTGAGKTNVAMLCILHELGLHRRQDGSIDTE